MDLDERLERANPVPLVVIPQPGSDEAERIYRAAFHRLEATPRAPLRTWSHPDGRSTKIGKGLTPVKELALLAAILVVMMTLAFSPIPRLVLGRSSTPATVLKTTTTLGAHGTKPTVRVFDGIIFVLPPPTGYHPKVAKMEVLARYTGPSSLAAGASSVTVFLGTVTDTGYTRDGRPVIDDRVAWVLYATGVEEHLLGCGRLGSTTSRSTCPPFVRAHLVELVSPMTGDAIDANEY